MRALEEHLAHADWLAAGHWTIADLGVGTWVELAAGLGMLADLPRTRAWIARVMSLPFVARTPSYELLHAPPARAVAATVDA